ncbi:hypothetical protein K432DRAFT_386798 [Lepidopterella palustris CBS 459.81]|uniref:A-kinase anchor protein 7-like phosphoesterase domain-containing protein n=1 Tax=Lepidopterella palustris CBS 459.81 TaxID=1314670 RepID=A0A8E2DZ75_9PEZI|nr:hypothetical protein K432DRAFT_386798 [Lepidopterella palustris CBS 459.81]
MPKPSRKRKQQNDFLDGEEAPVSSPIADSTHKSPFGRQSNIPTKQKKTHPLTHFLCLPLVTESSRPQLESSLKQFKDDVAREGGVKVAARGKVEPASLDGRAVRPVGTIHLTIGVMACQDAQMLRRAEKVLEELDLGKILTEVEKGEMKSAEVEQTADMPNNSNDVEMDDADADSGSHGRVPLPLDTLNPTTARDAMETTETLAEPVEPRVELPTELPAPLTISLTSLIAMARPASTNVLYAAPVDPTNRLYPFCLALQKRFLDAGLLRDEGRRLKLHATIVNTIYIRNKTATDKRAAEHQPQSDAMEIEEPKVEGVAVAQGDSAGVALVPEAVGDNDEALGTSEARKRRGTRRGSFLALDARDLIQRYEGFMWAKNVRIEKVAICKMGAKKTENEKGDVVAEEYEEVSSKAL